jgi:hypothetical protein
MFSRFLGKSKKAGAAPDAGAAAPRGLEVIEDDPESVWSLWDSALADQDSRLEPAQAEPEHVDLPVLVDVNDESDEPETPTHPMPLESKSLELRKADALEVVERHHQRIANTIRTLWGFRECSDYINKLIMSGGDGMGHARIGFQREAVEAMLALADIHDAQFGPASKDPVPEFGAQASPFGVDGAR